MNTGTWNAGSIPFPVVIRLPEMVIVSIGHFQERRVIKPLSNFSFQICITVTLQMSTVLCETEVLFGIDSFLFNSPSLQLTGIPCCQVFDCGTSLSFMPLQ
jgi:hypothetical protein